MGGIGSIKTNSISLEVMLDLRAKGEALHLIQGHMELTTCRCI